MSMTLGSMIKEQRLSKQLTLRYLSREVEVSIGLLSLIERDMHVPPKELIVKIASFLQIDPNQLCALADKLTPDVERHLARKAKADPKFLRTLISQIGDHNA